MVTANVRFPLKATGNLLDDIRANPAIIDSHQYEWAISITAKRERFGPQPLSSNTTLRTCNIISDCLIGISDPSN